MKTPGSVRPDTAAFRDRAYFNSLDGLRAISILLVLLHHTVAAAPGNPLSTLCENGRYGVGFFFVISGFLICTLFLREEDETGRIHLWKFYGRRALRLLPLYYVVLLLQAVLVFVLHQYTPANQELFRQKLPSYLFYYSNWLPTATQGPFFCSWSLAVEEQFYLVFGLLLFFASRRVVIGAVAVALIVKVTVYNWFGAVDAGSTLCRVLFSYREPILLGVLTAFALHRRATINFFVRWLGSPWTSGCIGAIAATWLCVHVMRQESFWDAQLLYLLMTLLLVSIVIRPDGAVLGNRWIVHVGKISYGIYLLHMFVISSVRKLPGGESPILCFLVSSVAAIALASLVYRFFERPIITYYKRRLSPRRLETSAADLSKPAAALA